MGLRDRYPLLFSAPRNKRGNVGRWWCYLGEKNLALAKYKMREMDWPCSCTMMMGVRGEAGWRYPKWVWADLWATDGASSPNPRFPERTVAKSGRVIIFPGSFWLPMPSLVVHERNRVGRKFVPWFSYLGRDWSAGKVWRIAAPAKPTPSWCP